MQKTFTNYDKSKINFDVVIDETLHNLHIADVNPNKKAVFSLINDFESGDWRLIKFNNFIWDNIKETALSAEERSAYIGRESTILSMAAEKVRFEKEDGNKGGEIAEILLYGIMKHYYSALPVVPKIFYKQNHNDYAKGADSVHILIENDGSFSLWLGESKFYTVAEESFDKIIESLTSMLSKIQLEKENSIITSIKDLDICINDSELSTKIKQTISNGVSLDKTKKILHIPILLLHQCDITKNNTKHYDDYKKDIYNQHLGFAKKLLKKIDDSLSGIYGFNDIHFHFILFPVKNKAIILKQFVNKVNANKN